MPNNKKRRADKAAKHLKNYRDFHKPANSIKPKKILPLVCLNEPKKSIDDLTEYEVDQIWAEVMHIYRTEGFDPEQSAEEIETLLKADPELNEVSQILTNHFASKATVRKDLEPVKR